MKLTQEQLRKSAEALAKLHGVPVKAAVQLVAESYNQGYADAELAAENLRKERTE